MEEGGDWGEGDELGFGGGREIKCGSGSVCKEKMKMKSECY